MSEDLGPKLGRRLQHGERKPRRPRAPAPRPAKLRLLRKAADRKTERLRIEYLRRQNRLPLWPADDEPRPAA